MPSHSRHNSRTHPPPPGDPRDRLPGLQSAWDKLTAEIQQEINGFGSCLVSLREIIRCFWEAEPIAVLPHHICLLFRYLPRCPWRDYEDLEQTVARFWPDISLDAHSRRRRGRSQTSRNRKATSSKKRLRRRTRRCNLINSNARLRSSRRRFSNQSSGSFPITSPRD